jgi:hypothetical protein
MAPVIKDAGMLEKRRDIIQENIIPGVASIPISKQIDETIKRSKSTFQRLKILNLCMQRYLKGQHWRVNRNLTKEYVSKILHRFKKQQERLVDSIFKMIDICGEIMKYRKKHIEALENDRNKKNYDNMTEYQTYVLETQGKDDFEKYIQKIKCEFFGEEAVQKLATDSANKIPKYLRLKTRQKSEQFNGRILHRR